jgi:hypothetical protein
MMRYVVETPVLSAIFLAVIFLAGCGPSKESGGVTVAQTQALESFESLLPIETDSVIELYRQNDPARFYATYKRQLEDISRYVDSLNRMLDTHSRIDTLAIDHTFENFGTAACAGRTIYLSSSYFLLYNDATVVRSVVTHEFGHIVYQRLSDPVRIRFEELWVQLSNAALLYLFRDGEYSGNAKFGGHPYDSPAEFFASAFNLFSNREKELQSRLQYVDPDHFPLIERLKRTVVEATSVR